ncbi:MAG: DNA-directed RNA polymerase subunit sigma24 [Planctomycetota bacterium]|nr:MAG: DNA-directed RNA polymerase subunit sigma24 [Planctomycetota bacterium]
MSRLDSVLESGSLGEAEVVRRYSERLLAFARTKLPANLARRVDPEDVVQSAYRSFFRRLKQGEFQFDEDHNVWQLLAAITFCKTQNLVKHHYRQKRDARRDEPTPVSDGLRDRVPGPEDLAIFYESLESLLTGLPDNYRELVLLRLEGYSIAEIAQRVQRSQRTVLRVLSRLRELGETQLESPS